MKDIESKRDRYVELVDIPSIKSESYKTAKKNIIKFEDDTSPFSEDTKKDSSK